jgi:hypothetical protein
MLPERYNECENIAGDQRQSQILRRMRMFGGADTGRLSQMLKGGTGEFFATGTLISAY